MSMNKQMTELINSVYNHFLLTQIFSFLVALSDHLLVANGDDAARYSFVTFPVSITTSIVIITVIAVIVVCVILTYGILCVKWYVSHQPLVLSRIDSKQRMASF